MKYLAPHNHLKASLKAELNNYKAKALRSKISFTQRDLQYLQQPHPPLCGRKNNWWFCKVSVILFLCYCESAVIYIFIQSLKFYCTHFSHFLVLKRSVLSIISKISQEQQRPSILTRSHTALEATMENIARRLVTNGREQRQVQIKRG